MREGRGMARHEFAILKQTPSWDDIFDTYEPERYRCITVDDDFIEPILTDLREMDCYWHTLEKPEKGLAYYGITLIPPQSLETFLRIISSQNKREYAPLIQMAMDAKENGNYLIHFGI